LLASPETRKWFINEGAEAVNRTPEEFRKWILAEMVKWTKVAKQAASRRNSASAAAGGPYKRSFRLRGCMRDR